MQRAVLAIDEGTTNSKAILVLESGEIVARGSCPVETRHPQSGWVEQDARQVWSSTVAAIGECLSNGPEVEIVAIGISNQRESIMIWDRQTGAPLGPLVTWQCRRTAAACEALKVAGQEDEVIARTGLPLDPLFPATKVGWLLETHCAGKPAGDICIGTVDSWLIWNLSGGKVHACDASNAARTQLYNIADCQWDETLCRLFKVPMTALPQVHDSSHVFARTEGVDGLPDGVPVASAIGDSHGALFGHGAYHPGDGKVTFGTGSSVMTTLPEFIVPPTGLTTTIAWSLNGRPTYAFEGNILVSASILPWTAELLAQKDVTALLELAQTVDSTLGVTLVPAHVGLGSPHWNANARGLICGLSFNAGKAHLARAAAESIALQVADVFEIVTQNSGQGIARLFVDGGPSRNPFLMGMVADFIDHPVIVGESTEASAQGAAYLAGLAIGLWPDLETLSALEEHGREIAPTISATDRERARSAWRMAITRTTLDSA
ncbi:FGGY family carbohydrate kinase [Aliiruegeria sabulilitoris]|uniref:FGGY family carbohydrate kinase n=1 Tax=Aliiruegeria sabulilitoris TaxID=1510458 RepID=UPI000832C5CB|nr:FGGY-family carbohydrate kinase [Aliiruegeria sabulilitoris]NDR57850.1 glycerol kinase [Pseudoruegeria sp. M32A2M]